MTVVELMCLLEETGDLDAEVLVGSWDGTVDTVAQVGAQQLPGSPRAVIIAASGWPGNQAGPDLTSG